MSDKLRICVVTGSRAEYGLLYWIIRDLNDSKDLDLQLVVTGQHLAPEFGCTVSVIEADGFTVADRVDMLVSGDSSRALTKSVGLGVIGFADTYSRLQPDIVLLLGDRFEILAAAQAALFANIPIAHVAGGDTTEGAFDEAIRHSVTKMAHVHFVTNELAAKRVVQMGERPDCVHVVGSPGIDNIRRLKLLGREELERDLGVKFLARNLLVTFHPVTLEGDESHSQFEELLGALTALEPAHGLFFTMPNADTGGRRLAARLQQWAQGRRGVHVFTSLGQLRYLSLMSVVDAVVGNSSSGLYEAPSFRIPTVNIGSRQRGRLAASSVIHCEPRCAEILAALHHAEKLDCSSTVNPYGDGNSAARIAGVLKSLTRPRDLLQKHFHMLGE